MVCVVIIVIIIIIIIITIVVIIVIIIIIIIIIIVTLLFIFRLLQCPLWQGGRTRMDLPSQLGSAWILSTHPSRKINHISTGKEYSTAVIYCWNLMDTMWNSHLKAGF